MKHTFKTIILLFILLFILVCLISYLQIETYNNIPEYLKHKTKSFSAEKQAIQMYGIEQAWRGQPVKSVDAQFDGIKQAGYDPAGGFLGTSIKYY